MQTKDIFKERVETVRNLSFDSPEKVEEAFSYSKYLYQNEEFRMKNIERKASIINAASLISMVMITWLLGSIFYEVTNISLLIMIIFLILYLIIVYLIYKTISFSLSVTNYNGLNISLPDAAKIYNLKDQDIHKFKNSLAVQYFISYDKVKKHNDQNDIFVNRAQKNIKIIIILLLLFGIVFVIDAVCAKKIHMRYISGVLEYISKF